MDEALNVVSIITVAISVYGKCIESTKTIIFFSRFKGKL